MTAASGPRRADLDDTDKALIRALQVDGRTPYSQLAPLVGLSEAATRQRVNRLVERGVVSIVAVTDPMALGYGYQALLGITVDSDVAATAEKLGQIDELEYVVITAGRYNVIAEVVCTDAEHLLAVTDDKIRAVAGVRTVETLTYLRIVKQIYDWGTM
ncbi:MAG: Lrp/AsnC family transcriptional regulator [Acidimicrobiales bacterium]